MIIEDLFCQVDDFCQAFMPDWEQSLIDQGVCRKAWQCQMAPSEIMTVVILFHQASYRNFKNFYIGYIQRF